MMNAMRTTVPTPTDVVGGSYAGAGGGDTSGTLPGEGGGEVTARAGGGGLSRCGGDGGSGGKSFLLHALGGPSKHDLSSGSGTPSPYEQPIPIHTSFPSLRWYLASHAVAIKNMFSEATSELVSQLVISASNVGAL